MNPHSGESIDPRDALDDAIRRAYCTPVRTIVDGEDAELVRSLAISAVITNPDRMRHLAAIQAAAYEVVKDWLLDPAEAEVGRLRELQARIDKLDSLCGEWGSLGRLLESVSNGLATTADWHNSNTDKRACEALRRVAHELDLLERDS